MPYARVDNARLFYREQGRGPPLLMIMGLGATHHAWIAQVPAFSRRFRTITYDSRGLGRSRDTGERYPFCALTGDALALLDHLEIERAHVLGYSLGGAVAQELAVEHPDRVRGLVLAASLARGRSVEVSPEMRQALGIGPEDDLGSVKVDELQVDFARIMPAMARASFGTPILRWWLSASSHRYARLISLDGVRRQGFAAFEVDTFDRLHRIQSPTLVITGTEDQLVPPRISEEIARRIPQAKLVKVEGASHALAFERAWRFNREVLRFLGDR